MPALPPAVNQAKPAPAVEQPVVAVAPPKPEPKPTPPPADNQAKRAPVGERPVASAEPSKGKPALPPAVNQAKPAPAAERPVAAVEPPNGAEAGAGRQPREACARRRAAGRAAPPEKSPKRAPPEAQPKQAGVERPALPTEERKPEIRILGHGKPDEAGAGGRTFGRRQRSAEAPCCAVGHRNPNQARAAGARDGAAQGGDEACRERQPPEAGAGLKASGRGGATPERRAEACSDETSGGGPAPGRCGRASQGGAEAASERRAAHAADGRRRPPGPRAPNCRAAAAPGARASHRTIESRPVGEGRPARRPADRARIYGSGSARSTAGEASAPRAQASQPDGGSLRTAAAARGGFGATRYAYPLANGAGWVEERRFP